MQVIHYCQQKHYHSHDYTTALQESQFQTAQPLHIGIRKNFGLEIAWKAQWRLHTRYKKLSARGKNKNQIVTAIGQTARHP
jgi:hypothetical protein